MNTHYGNKTARWTHNGETVNAFRYIDADSTLMLLGLGTNAFQASADTGSSDLDITLTYSNQYLGV